MADGGFAEDGDIIIDGHTDGRVDAVCVCVARIGHSPIQRTKMELEPYVPGRSGTSHFAS